MLTSTCCTCSNYDIPLCMCVFVCMFVCVCVRACVRACVCVTFTCSWYSSKMCNAVLEYIGIAQYEAS